MLRSACGQVDRLQVGPRWRLGAARLGQRVHGRAQVVHDDLRLRHDPCREHQHGGLLRQRGRNHPAWLAVGANREVGAMGRAEGVARDIPSQRQGGAVDAGGGPALADGEVDGARLQWLAGSVQQCVGRGHEGVGAGATAGNRAAGGTGTLAGMHRTTPCG